MKTILRNFISVFRRFKTATILNILGLSVAFGAFIVLMMQVSYDWGYDRFHKNTNQLYRLELTNPGANWATLSRPLIDKFISSSPHIKAGTLIKNWDNLRNIAVENNGERNGFQEIYKRVYPNYPEVFDFKMVEGERSALSSPNRVLIPESMARKLFPNSSAIGKQLISDELKAEIGGVYRDIPDNSLIENAIYQKMPDDEGINEWSYNNYECFILIDTPSNIPSVLADFKKNFTHEVFDWNKQDLRMTNLPDIYYLTDIIFDSKTKGSYTQIFILFCIALLIVAIAAINFTNFSNALVPVRLKGINTQKVLGCSVKSLRLSILVEAITICLISFCLALYLVYLLSDTVFSDMVNGGINFKMHTSLLIGSGVLALLVGLLAGIWPSYYITSFPPALILKGNFGLSPKGRSLRNVLVSVQFVTSFVLITGAIFVSLQNSHMLHSSLGFDQDQVATIKLNKKLAQNTQLLRLELKELTGIEEVATVDRIIGGGDTYSTMGITYKGEDISYRQIFADPSILRVLGLNVTDGRDFVAEDFTNGAFIFNETAKRAYNLELGNTEKGYIVGFMNDIKYNSYRGELEPFGFFAHTGFGPRDYAMIRISAGTNYTTLVESIRKTLNNIDQDYPLEINLYNEVLENLYKTELILGRQITFFGLVAIFLSLVGVFGVVLFESEYKRREIGIRKVFGSTIREILLLLSNKYVRLLCVCFVLSVPLAWYVISNWLKNFSYKTPLYWWVFALAFVTVTLITLVTVTIQNWRAANANPIDSIRAE